MRPGLARIVGLGLALGLGAGLGCDREPARPNVVIVVLDTVRRDYTGCGGGASSTPNLDALAEAGACFTHAWATAPWTPPSHASMLTGLLPSSHGWTSKSPRFASEAPTVAELLGGAGYATVAFHSNPFLSMDLTDLLRGFDQEFVAGPRGSGIFDIFVMTRQGGRGTIDNIARWLDGDSREAPFFMLVNFLEAHLPYNPSPTYRELYLSDVAPGSYVATEWAHAFNAGCFSADEVDWDFVRRMYAGDVHTADGFLGELLALLRARGLLGNTVVIVTSDHGENLGDHGFMDHQYGVFETLLAVPLVVHAPGRLATGVRDDPVMLTDIFATVLDAAGLSEVAAPEHSRSLLGPPAAADRPIIAEYAGPGPPLFARLLSFNPEMDIEPLRPAYVTVRVGNLRLTVGSDGSEVLNDLAADPEGLVNLAPERPAEVDRLLRLGPGFRTGDNEGLEIDERMREWLESLGYFM
jgi:arylsulfatase A-like enzyme